MSDRRKPTFLCENTLKANGEGGDKRVTRDSLNNMPFALYNVNVSKQLDKSLRQLHQVESVSYNNITSFTTPEPKKE